MNPPKIYQIIKTKIKNLKLLEVWETRCKKNWILSDKIGSLAYSDMVCEWRHWEPVRGCVAHAPVKARAGGSFGGIVSVCERGKRNPEEMESRSLKKGGTRGENMITSLEIRPFLARRL